MSDHINDGGSAFPTYEKIGEEIGEDGVWRDIFGSFGGMTLRDYFAAKAMQALLTAEPDRGVIYLVANAFEVADAVLKAREAK